MTAFGGDDVDTLTLMFDKLQYIFRGYDSYIQAFTEMHKLYEQGKLPEKDYYYGMNDVVLKFSALEFLGLKAMFEIKKALNRMNNASSKRSSISGLTSGTTIDQTMSGPQNTLDSFIRAKSLPGRDKLTPKTEENRKHCSCCNNLVQLTTKFCTNCGNKI